MLNRSWDRHKRLADRLRREAGDARPAFSSGLHQRIMQTLCAEARVERLPVRRRPHWTWALASAAVVLISVGAAYWGLPPADGPENSAQLARHPNGPAPSIPRVPPSGLSGPADAAGEELSPDAHQSDGFDAFSELFDVAVDHVETIQKAENVVESDLVGEQLAMLDHDARIVAGWLIDPIAATLED